MEMNNVDKANEIQVELPDELSQGTYANLAIVAHSSSDFVIDFIRMLPGVAKAKVQSRIILTPDNAKRLLLALDDNIRKFDVMIAGSADNIIPQIGKIKGDA